MSFNLTKKFAAVAAVALGLGGCAAPTVFQTSQMSRSPAVEDPALRTPVTVDPCHRANIEYVYNGDVEGTELARAKANGSYLGYHRAFHLVSNPSLFDQAGTAIGAIAGGVLGNVAGKALGAKGGSRTAGIAIGAIGGAVVGEGLSREQQAARLTEVKACKQYLNQLMADERIPDQAPVRVAPERSYGRYPSPSQILQFRPNFPGRW